jgi:methylated-DNA-[protein]-cysteine S-methyltransferase
MKFEIADTEIEIELDRISEDEEEIQRQLQEYKNGDRKSFDLEISFPDGFIGEVMKKMSQIPYGETRSYGEIAENIDSAAVAVGQACGKNPAPLIIPCHRVVGKNSIGGYAYGEEVKQKLLELEGADF